MKSRLRATLLGIILGLSFSVQAFAFNIGPVVNEVSSSPDIVNGMYIGQTQKEFYKAFNPSDWDVKKGISELDEPTVTLWRERGPKVRQSIYVSFDQAEDRVRFIAVEFTTDDSSYTRDIAETMFQNIAALNLYPEDIEYKKDRIFAVWKMGSAFDERKVRVEYDEHGARIVRVGPKA